jgi:hypothetical protein
MVLYEMIELPTGARRHNACLCPTAWSPLGQCLLVVEGMGLPCSFLMEDFAFLTKHFQILKSWKKIDCRASFVGAALVAQYVWHRSWVWRVQFRIFQPHVVMSKHCNATNPANFEGAGSLSRGNQKWRYVWGLVSDLKRLRCKFWIFKGMKLIRSLKKQLVHKKNLLTHTLDRLTLLAKTGSELCISVHAMGRCVR